MKSIKETQKNTFLLVSLMVPTRLKKTKPWKREDYLGRGRGVDRAGRMETVPGAVSHSNQSSLHMERYHSENIVFNSIC